MASLGKTVRLMRLKNSRSGRMLTVAMDHAPSYGVLEGLENIQEVLRKVAEGEPDAMLMMKGTAERCFEPYAGRISLILKCSCLSPLHPEHDVWVSSVEDALQLGADAMSMAVTFGSVHQAEHLENLSALVREAGAVNMPVVAHAYPNGEQIPPDEVFSAKQVGYASRAAMELGVDIVKTFYTGSAESFAEVVKMASPALVVAAGGPKLESKKDVLEMARNVVKARAAGITFGRNVWQSADVAGMIGELSGILHGS